VALAEVAALRVVGHVIRVVQLERLQHDVPRADLASDGLRLFQLGPWDTGRVRGQGKGSVAQRVNRYLEQKSAVGATGISDGNRSHFLQKGLEFCILLMYHIFVTGRNQISVDCSPEEQR
jgi:hypothetical protein